MIHRSSLPVAAATLAFAVAASAQVGTLYTFTQTAGTYTPITGGTLIATATSAQTLDDVTFAVTLPFTFNYDNAPQTQVQVQTNGHLAFGGVSPGTTYTPISSAAVTPGFVAACGRDLQGGYVCASTRTLGSNQVTAISAVGPLSVGDTLVGTGIPAGTTVTAIAGNTLTMSANATATSTGTAMTAYGPWSEIRWEVQGTTPNQVFIVQWSNFRRFGTALATTQDTNLNFQIRLNENGCIECVYGNCTPGATTTTALHQVGLRGPNNSFPTNVNNRQNTKGVDDWATSAPGIANGSGELFNNVAPANVIPNGLTYTWCPPQGTLATNTSLGQGCYSRFASYYENFGAGTPVDLVGSCITHTPNGGGYTVAQAGPGWQPPGPAAVVVPLTDDSQAAVGTLGLTVGSNGWVAFGGGNSNAFTPSVATMLANPSTAIYCWHDLNPAIVGSGQVFYEETVTPTTGTAIITYNGVWDFGGTGPANANNIRIVITCDFSNLTWTIEIEINLISGLGTTGWLFGLSPGGPSNDPGNRDISTSLAGGLTFDIVGTDVLPLALAATSRPVTGTNWNLAVSNGGLLDLVIIGTTDPMIPDLFFLGLPGCGLRASLDVISVGSTFSLGIPNNPTLIGASLYANGASFVPGVNPFGAITSNGMQGNIGDV